MLCNTSKRLTVLTQDTIQQGRKITGARENTASHIITTCRIHIFVLLKCPKVPLVHLDLPFQSHLQCAIHKTLCIYSSKLYQRFLIMSTQLLKKLPCSFHFTHIMTITVYHLNFDPHCLYRTHFANIHSVLSEWFNKIK